MCSDYQEVGPLPLCRADNMLVRTSEDDEALHTNTGPSRPRHQPLKLLLGPGPRACFDIVQHLGRVRALAEKRQHDTQDMQPSSVPMSGPKM